MKILLAPAQYTKEDIKADPNSVNPIVEITHPQEHLRMEEVWFNLIKPALLAYGFAESTINIIIKEDYQHQ